MWNIHSKSEKVCGTAFSLKKIAEKVRKSGRHIWAIWGNFGPFLGHFVAYLDKFAESSIFCGPVGVLGLAFRMYAPQ